MARLSLLGALLFYSPFGSLAQSSESERSESILWFTTFVGVGRSTFEANLSAPSKFATVELRVGGGVTRRLTEVLDIQGRFVLGVKGMRQSFNQQREPSRVGPPFLQLAETVSSRNHYFYEIPILLQANIGRPAISIKTGVNFRHFFPKNEDVDFLTARSEYGLIGGAAYRLNERISVGVDYCYGLTRVFSSSGSVDGSLYNLRVRNEFVQLTVEYSFRRIPTGD